MKKKIALLVFLFALITIGRMSPDEIDVMNNYANYQCQQIKNGIIPGTVHNNCGE